MDSVAIVEVRPLQGFDELKQAEHLQWLVWQMDDPTDILPLSILLPISKHSGVVLGAFEGQTLVGLCVGIMGRDPSGQVCHWSHINGVLPEKRALGLGAQLKWAQRSAVLAMGLDLIRWTVDPLEGLNNSLNFGKLGVTSHTYERNTYGVMLDGLNAGIDSDRFIVDWHIDTPRVKTRHAEGKPALSPRAWQEAGAVPANLTQALGPDLRHTTETRVDLDAPRVLVEIPASYQNVKRHDLELAIKWRMQTRELFETYFERGYVATEFASEERDGERRNYYLLIKA